MLEVGSQKTEENTAFDSGSGSSSCSISTKYELIRTYEVRK
ncbi:MAG: hypothetical protein V2A54_06755 [Bacteroidota bacterium]